LDISSGNHPPNDQPKNDGFLRERRKGSWEGARVDGEREELHGFAIFSLCFFFF